MGTDGEYRRLRTWKERKEEEMRDHERKEEIKNVLHELGKLAEEGKVDIINHSATETTSITNEHLKRCDNSHSSTKSDKPPLSDKGDTSKETEDTIIETDMDDVSKDVNPHNVTRIKRTIDRKREIQGLLLAKSKKITKTQNGWLVPGSKRKKYDVTVKGGNQYECNCPDYQNRLTVCKHIHAVKAIENNVEIPPENALKQELEHIRKKGKNYSQNWPAYTKAQCNEKEMFLLILMELCKLIVPPEPEQRPRGRPPVPLNDVLFCTVYKVYSMFSGRRFDSDARRALENMYISHKPHHNTIFNYLKKPELTDILTRMIELVSTPLADIENSFAMDSSGFSTMTYESWNDLKYGKKKEKKWLKAHINVGVKTNIVVAAKITDSNVADSSVFEHLFHRTTHHFNVDNQLADGAYSSRIIHEIINEAGAAPYIPFSKSANRRPRSLGIWGRMYDMFHNRRSEFLLHYTARNNVESVFQMVKSKFGRKLMSKSSQAQINELLCKILCHNIVVLIHELHEHNVSIDSLMDDEGEDGVHAINIANKSGLNVNFYLPNEVYSHGF